MRNTDEKTKFINEMLNFFETVYCKFSKNRIFYQSIFHSYSFGIIRPFPMHYFFHSG